jgi:hypothetical protein
MSTTKTDQHDHSLNENNPSLSSPSKSQVKPDETRAGVLVDWRGAEAEKSSPESASDTMRDGK